MEEDSTEGDEEDGFENVARCGSCRNQQSRLETIGMQPNSRKKGLKMLHNDSHVYMHVYCKALTQIYTVVPLATRVQSIYMYMYMYDHLLDLKQSIFITINMLAGKPDYRVSPLYCRVHCNNKNTGNYFFINSGDTSNSGSKMYTKQKKTNKKNILILINV